MQRIPAWKLIIEKNLLSSRDEAERWIMAGKVMANDMRITKAGELLSKDAILRLKASPSSYVSRGGDKLAAALQAFGIEVAEMVALDAGASTGGFTDCLLSHGASRVYAVDTGFGQLHSSLQHNERVVNMERVNIGDESLQTLSPPPELITLDLSYLSLALAIPQAASILGETGCMICLVKPLFEVADASLRRSGKNPDEYQLRIILANLLTEISGRGYYLRGVIASPIRGSSGTVEFFISFDLTPEPAKVYPSGDDIKRQIERAVQMQQKL